MYYRIMGNDGNPYASGLNCTSKEDVKEQWVDLNYDQIDDEEDQATYADRDLNDLLASQDAYLEESETPCPDPDEDVPFGNHNEEGEGGMFSNEFFL